MTETDLTVAALARIAEPPLAEFGKELLAHGFRVFLFRSDFTRVTNGGREACATWLGFARTVEGHECFGSVSNSLSGFQFTMPIKASRQHGSAMFISGDTISEFEELSLTNAELYPTPTGQNRLVGTQTNHCNWLDLCVEVSG